MDQTRPRAGLETRCPAFGVYASCPKLFLGRLVGPYAYVYGSCPCRQNQRQMPGMERVAGKLGLALGLQQCSWSVATWEITSGNHCLKHEIEPIRCI
ncbi:hypothetical protein DPX16_20736 [Anabarilius grahami]|uniref:Uncharacterized protein n=1 Tax=Anabarilius grahami TaxID=495550 RepID=A0A3N0YE76_ANAGA|nr:hypothetical protein DPX16_20736 [Anabarilius grahami]